MKKKKKFGEYLSCNNQSFMASNNLYNNLYSSADDSVVYLRRDTWQVRTSDISRINFLIERALDMIWNVEYDYLLRIVLISTYSSSGLYMKAK